MQRITKLTPKRIKQIIQEEREYVQEKLEKEEAHQKQKLLEQLRLLKKIVNAQKNASKKTKQLNELKQKIIKKIKD